MPTCINSRPPDALAGVAHTTYIQFSIRGKPSLDLCLTSSKQAACMTLELDLVSLEASLGPSAQHSTASYTAGTILHHLQHAKSKGWELANGEMPVSLHIVY